jgi:hypothetical protein
MSNSKVFVSLINKPSSLFFKGCLKFYLKKFLRKILSIQRGPDVVLKSLVRGLNLKGITYNVNPTYSNLSSTVHVLSNPTALEWAIKQKNAGKINKLVAGPNISILPSVDNHLMSNPAVDIVLLPSLWTKDAFVTDSPSIENQIRIWPSGVEIPPEIHQPKKDLFLLYKKNFKENDFKSITSSLQKLGVAFTTLTYGTFKQSEYFKLLSEVKGVIYLQKSESQGIALQEAWARDVPTLVWDAKTYTYPNSDITVSEKVGAPYLTEECGMFFDSIESFETTFKLFNERISSFNTREYCIENLSDEASVSKYLKYLSYDHT